MAEKKIKKMNEAEKRERKKSTKAEINRRVFAVYSFMLRGADRVKIIQHGAKLWNITTRQIDEYIAAAKRWLELSHEDNKKNELLKSVAQRMDLYYKALEDGNTSVCHEIRKDLDKLRGLYPSEKAKITLTGEIKTDSQTDVNKVLDTKIEGTNKTVAEIMRDAYRNQSKK